jgi:hypothetical protein
LSRRPGVANSNQDLFAMKTHTRSARLSFEPLESRYVPAVTIVNPHTATYTDVDGDFVTIKVSSSTLSAADFATVPVGIGDQLQLIHVTNGVDGANLTVSVKKSPAGDGQAAIGYIDAIGHNLGTVNIAGDLGRINVGTNSPTTPAIKSLSVRSLGRYGLLTQRGGSLESDIHGALGALTVKGDDCAFINVFGGATATIGSVNITGSLLGGKNVDSGEIMSSGDMGRVTIGQNVQGGSVAQSGFIDSNGKLAGVVIGGSLIGGLSTYTGRVTSIGVMGPVRIGGDIVGGAGLQSGSIDGGLGLASVNIRGSLVGGSNDQSGRIRSNSTMGDVRIGHDIKGGTGTHSGSIYSFVLGAVKIGGSLIGGSNDGSGRVETNGGSMGLIKISHDLVGNSGNQSGSIQADTGVAGVQIGGSLIGGLGTQSGFIVCEGEMGPIQIGGGVTGGGGPASGYVIAFGNLARVSVGGSLVGGSGGTSGGISSGLDMGPVSIGGDLLGGSIAGAAPDLYGSGFIESQQGRIASLNIGGSIISGTDNSIAGHLFQCAMVRAHDDIGSLTVNGSIIGNATANSPSLVVISARGQHTPGATTDLAIGTIHIGGRVQFANFLAGYVTDIAFPAQLAPINGEAQIGSVHVGGDWIDSNLVAGVANFASTNTQFGNNDDRPIPVLIGLGNTKITSSIGSISIGGTVVGTSKPSDHFGFCAEQIGAVTIGGATVRHKSGLNNDVIELSPITGDVTIREVA